MRGRKRNLLGLCGFVGLLFASLPTHALQLPSPSPTKKMGKAKVDQPIADFALRDLMHTLKQNEKEEDAEIRLSQFKDKKPVLLFFTSELCGVTARYESRVKAVIKKYGAKEVAVLAVRCSATDTTQGLVKWMHDKKYTIPLLNDGKGRITAYFKLLATPAFVLIDKGGVLRYKGAFDDNPEEGKAKRHYLTDALTAVISGKTVTVKETPAFGCSIAPFAN